MASGLVGNLQRQVWPAFWEKITQADFSSETQERIDLGIRCSVGFFDYEQRRKYGCVRRSSDPAGKEHNHLFHNVVKAIYRL